MAVALDVVGTGANAAAASSITVSLAAGSPSNVGIGTTFFSGFQTISSVTYAGAACALAVSDLRNDGIEVTVAIYEKSSPTGGTQNAVVNFTGAQFGTMDVISVTGANTSTTFSNTASAKGTSGAAITVTCGSASGELVMDTLYCSGAGNTPTGGQTKQWNVTDGLGMAGEGSTLAASGATTAMPWDNPSVQTWLIVAASFKVAAAGGVVSRWPQYMMSAHDGA